MSWHLKIFRLKCISNKQTRWTSYQGQPIKFPLSIKHLQMSRGAADKNQSRWWQPLKKHLQMSRGGGGASVPGLNPGTNVGCLFGSDWLSIYSR